MHSSEQVNRIEQLLLFSLKMATVNLTNTPSGIPEAGFFCPEHFRLSRIPASDENQNFNFVCLPRDGKPIIMQAEYLPLSCLLTTTA
jgi:hypothetical protein